MFLFSIRNLLAYFNLVESLDQNIRPHEQKPGPTHTTPASDGTNDDPLLKNSDDKAKIPLSQEADDSKKAASELETSQTDSSAHGAQDQEVQEHPHPPETPASGTAEISGPGKPTKYEVASDGSTIEHAMESVADASHVGAKSATSAFAREECQVATDLREAFNAQFNKCTDGKQVTYVNLKTKQRFKLNAAKNGWDLVTQDSPSTAAENADGEPAAGAEEPTDPPPPVPSTADDAESAESAAAAAAPPPRPERPDTFLDAIKKAADKTTEARTAAAAAGDEAAGAKTWLAAPPPAADGDNPVTHGGMDDMMRARRRQMFGGGDEDEDSDDEEDDDGTDEDDLFGGTKSLSASPANPVLSQAPPVHQSRGNDFEEFVFGRDADREEQAACEKIKAADTEKTHDVIQGYRVERKAGVFSTEEYPVLTESVVNGNQEWFYQYYRKNELSQYAWHVAKVGSTMWVRCP